MPHWMDNPWNFLTSIEWLIQTNHISFENYLYTVKSYFITIAYYLSIDYLPYSEICSELEEHCNSCPGCWEDEKDFDFKPWKQVNINRDWHLNVCLIINDKWVCLDVYLTFSFHLETDLLMVILMETGAPGKVRICLIKLYQTLLPSLIRKHFHKATPKIFRCLPFAFVFCPLRMSATKTSVCLKYDAYFLHVFRTETQEPIIIYQIFRWIRPCSGRWQIYWRLKRNGDRTTILSEWELIFRFHQQVRAEII